MSDRPTVLVKETSAEAGVDLLRERFDVEVGIDWPAGELEERIGEFDAILIRSATKMTAELIGRGSALRAIGAHRVASSTFSIVQSMQAVSASTSAGSIVGKSPIRSWLRPSLR